MADLSNLSDSELLAQLSDDDIKSMLGKVTDSTYSEKNPYGEKSVLEGISSGVTGISGGADYSEYNPLGMNQKSGMVGANPTQVSKGAFETGLGIIEGATSGLGRRFSPVSGMVTDVTKPDSFGRGNVTGQIGGFAAVPAQAADLVAKRVVGDVAKGVGLKVGRATAKEFIGNTIKNEFSNAGAKGVVAGGVGGLLAPQENPLDLKARLITGGITALTGGLVGAGIGGLKGFFDAKGLNQSAKRVTELLDRVRSTKVPVSSGPIYPIAGNPSNLNIVNEIGGVKAIVGQKVRPSYTPNQPNYNATNKAETLGIRNKAAEEIQNVRNARQSKLNFLKQKDVDAANLERTTQEVNGSHLDAAQSQLEDMLVQNTDEAIGKVKEVAPDFYGAKYEWYGNQVNKINEKMLKKGGSVNVSKLSNELQGILQKERLIGEPPYVRAPVNASERALLKWHADLNKYRQGELSGGTSNVASENLQDAVLDVKDVLARQSEVANGATRGDYGAMRIVGDTKKAVIDAFGDVGGDVSAMQQNYAKFAELRDFIDTTFEPNTQNIDKGRKALANIFNQKKSYVDMSLSPDQVRQLNQVEKELGIPFFSKLRSYGNDTAALEKQMADLKRMAANKVAFSPEEQAVRNQAASQIRDIAGKAKMAQDLAADKLARTNTVTEAITRRVSGELRNVFDKLRVPEMVARQMETAAVAYILTRVLAGAIKRND